jgi:hypothetical protein
MLPPKIKITSQKISNEPAIASTSGPWGNEVSVLKAGSKVCTTQCPLHGWKMEIADT